MKHVLPLIIASTLCLTSCLGEVMGEYAKIGQQVPTFEVETSGGEKISSASIVGRPCVIVFFNTQCTDCQKEFIKMQRLYEQYGHSVQFICISRNKSAEDIATYWQEHALSMPYSAQTDKRVFNLFAASRIPRTYVIDKDGKVCQVFVEKLNERKLRNKLSALCKKE